MFSHPGHCDLSDIHFLAVPWDFPFHEIFSPPRLFLHLEDYSWPTMNESFLFLASEQLLRRPRTLGAQLLPKHIVLAPFSLPISPLQTVGEMADLLQNTPAGPSSFSEHHQVF